MRCRRFHLLAAEDQVAHGGVARSEVPPEFVEGFDIVISVRVCDEVREGSTRQGRGPAKAGHREPAALACLEV
jgi:hypothetical protein